jgi:hypothetical protein
MKTLFDEKARQDLLVRIDRLTPDCMPRWGKMNAEQMLAHLVEAMKLGTGELQARPKKLLIRYTPLRQLFVYLLPWPKGAPTAKELIRRDSDAGTLARNREELARLVGVIASRADHRDWPEHPAFGRLSRRAWGVLGWRHTDHHLRQFGL